MISLILFSGMSSTQCAFAAMPPSFREGKLSLSAEGEYFASESNFTDDGSSTNLIGGHSYQNFTSSIDGTYFLTDQWAFAGGAGYAYASSSDNINDRSRGELTDIHAAALTQLTWKKFRFLPEVKALFSLTEVDPYGDDVLTHEGVNSYQGGSWVIYDIKKLRTYGFLGFQYRDSGRSALLPWTLGAATRIHRWTISGELTGYQSVTDDEYADNPSRRVAVANSVDGGSLRYYSVNPNLTEVQIETTWAFSPTLQIHAGVRHTLMGENTAEGQTYKAGLSYDWDLGGLVAAPSRKKTKDTSSDFQPAVEEDYDPSLFEEENSK